MNYSEASRVQVVVSMYGIAKKRRSVLVSGDDSASGNLFVKQAQSAHDSAKISMDSGPHSCHEERLLTAICDNR